ncbi:putative thylakoid soluble phosphoprotein TSP9 [Helianthus annuus]|nr:putative thylakoid soluble phosphoprotein TSP9 [Helianthus annuus]
MSSLNMFLGPATGISSSSTTPTTSITTSTTSIATTRARRLRTLATTKGSSGSSEEKSFLEWLAGALEKDGFVETDPLLQKVEGKTTSGTRTVSSKKTVAAPPKKSGGESSGGFAGLAGLFSKK